MNKYFPWVWTFGSICATWISYLLHFTLLSVIGFSIGIYLISLIEYCYRKAKEETHETRRPNKRT